jgi:hypothetical protein
VDARHFDVLVSKFTSPHSRRRLLTVLAALPVPGGLLGLLDPAETEAKERRRRRKQRHKKRKHPGQRKKGCRRKSTAQVCAGQCGAVKTRETCGKTVDCGSCDCPQPCGACLTCQSGPNAIGTCVPDPAQNGDACDDGAPCMTGSVCAAGVCGGGTPVICPATDCQIPGVCDPGTGTCTSPGFKALGTACASQLCGECDGLGDCEANAACSGTTPVCDGGTCVACSAIKPCLSGCCNLVTGACVTDCPVQYCHAITAKSGACPTGATEFCQDVPIQATSSAHALHACETCFGEGACTQEHACGGGGWGDAGNTTILRFTNATCCSALAGEIVSDLCGFLGRWAP